MKSKTATRNYDIDMTHGALFSKIVLFSVPLMLSGMLQLLFNAADVIVVGRFVGESSLAAVGSTGSLTNLLINLFIGFSTGTNVLTAQAVGAGDKKLANDTVHTSILFSVICGAFLAVVGFALAKPMLVLMDTPADVIEKAATYMKIYFLGMPVCMLYNFGNAIMRALGDTRRPMYYLIFAGIVNVVLNIVFVTKFDMDVAGVAYATVISQAISAFLIVRSLCKLDNECRLNLKKLRMSGSVIARMMKIGLPAGIQGMMFSISNVLIQSSVNFFGKTVMAGNAAAQNIEGFVYTAMNSVHQTAVSFTSQNYGARNFDRIKKVFLQCTVVVTVVGIALSTIVLRFGEQLLPLYSNTQGVIEYGLLRFKYVCATYFLCGVMEAIVGVIRGMGSSVVPMIFSLIWACVYRSAWVLTVFEQHKNLETLYISYPISWIATIVCQLVYFIWLYKREKTKYEQKKLN